MKTLLSFVSASVLAVSFSFAQVPGIPGLSRATVASGPQGTTLGANTTSSAGGIDLANRVKLRGYVDFMYKNDDDECELHSTRSRFRHCRRCRLPFRLFPGNCGIHTGLNHSGCCSRTGLHPLQRQSRLQHKHGSPTDHTWFRRGRSYPISTKFPMPTFLATGQVPLQFLVYLLVLMLVEIMLMEFVLISTTDALVSPWVCTTPFSQMMVPLNPVT